MGQKGKFLSQRAGYTNLWSDMWYTYRSYHSIYFQNFIVREILLYLMTVGLTTTSLILSPQKKISNLIHMSFLGTNMYVNKFKTDFNSTFWGKEFVRHLRGIFLTKLHVVKLHTHIIISGAGYRWRKKRTKSKRLFKAEQRICLFYSSVLLLENYNVNNYELDL